MNSLKKTASALVLAATTAFAAPAFATYYPEYPSQPETPSTTVTNNNDNSNYNKNNNSNSNHNNNSNYNKNNNSNSNYNGNSNNNSNVANGGQGGQGGTGVGVGVGIGQGGNATGGNATGGNATGGTSHSNATGGAANSNASGGEAESSANAAGGASNSGGNNMSMNNNYEAQKPMGNVAATTIIPAGNCGEGWALNVSIPFFGAGGGKTTQSKFCLSQDAAKTAINAGLVAQDTGMVATGLAGLRNLHPEFDQAANTVVENLVKPCAAQAAKISAIVLTQPGLQCTGEYVAGTEAFARSLQAPVVAVPVQPLRVEIVNPVRVEGVVKTKEEPRPVVRRAAPAPRAVVAPKPVDPCGCK